MRANLLPSTIGRISRINVVGAQGLVRSAGGRGGGWAQGWVRVRARALSAPLCARAVARAGCV